MIEISRYAPIIRGSVVGEVDVIIPTLKMQINKIQECIKRDRRWFNFPSFCEETAGDRKFFPYVDILDPDKKKAFFEEVRKCLEVFKEQQEKYEGLPF
ncbi:hypothetical protein LCGC14_1290540 [marine sediment metagenome]|uniref:Uncharacterized protein n=1 Tax=marine sediment metagenome TaxID=412755 RepID=A0A0F9KU95_9ZZZZ